MNAPNCPNCGIPMVDRWHGRSNCIAELRARLEESRSELAELRASWAHWVRVAGEAVKARDEARSGREVAREEGAYHRAQTGEARAKALADAAEVCRTIKARDGDVRAWVTDLMEECEETILALDKSEKP